MLGVVVSDNLQPLNIKGFEMKARCEWTPDDDGTWNTGCGNSLVFIAQGPAENNFKFCPYCGGSLRENPPNDAD